MCSFFSKPPLSVTLFNNITPINYGVKTKLNSQGKVIYSCLEKNVKNNVVCFYL